METRDHHTTLDDEFARETGALTVRRWTIGLTIYFLFAFAGAVVEWRYYPERGLPLLLALLAQGAVIGAAFVGVRRTMTHPTTGWISLSGNVGVCLVLAAYNAYVHGAMLYVLFTYLSYMLVASVFIPWGARFQFTMNAGIVAAYVLALAGGAHSGPIPAYEYIAITASAIFSTLGAHYIDQYRRQLHAQAAALRTANERLHAASQARTELLNGLSHDMRTPLSVLIGYAEILHESAALPADLRGPVRSVRREAYELLHLVNGVLDLARLEGGQLPFQRSTFLLADVLDPLRETTEDLLRDRGDVALRWQIAEGLSLDSDASKVREIARNLLSNAVKYTKEGEIRFQASASNEGVEIAVTDTGVGIAAEHVKLIFDPFRQIERGTAHRLSSMGFGLFMVKILVGWLGGRIDVRSALNAGSTFCVWLPPHPPPEAFSSQLSAGFADPRPPAPDPHPK